MKPSVGDRVSRHRTALRARGLRPVQIWLPDVRSPVFKEEALRQSRLVAEAREERDVMDFLEEVQDFGDAP